MRIVVGSKNPTKVEGARIAFEQFFGKVEVESVEVKTKPQPFDEESTKKRFLERWTEPLKAIRIHMIFQLE